MPDTTNFDWPYPGSTDHARIWEHIQALADAADATLGSAWSTYTPVWTAGTTNPVLGVGGTLTGRYRVVGKTANITIVMVAGAATTFGFGGWRFSLPFTPRINGLLSAFVNDSSAGSRWAGSARIIGASATGDNMRIVVQDASGSVLNTNPMAWATGDELILHGTLELA